MEMQQDARRFKVLETETGVKPKQAVISELNDVLASVVGGIAEIQKYGADAFSSMSRLRDIPACEHDRLAKFSLAYLQAIKRIGHEVSLFLSSSENRGRTYFTQLAKTIKASHLHSATPEFFVPNLERLTRDYVLAQEARIHVMSLGRSESARKEISLAAANLSALLLSAKEIRSTVDAISDPTSTEAQRLRVSSDIMREARNRGGTKPSEILSSAVEITYRRFGQIPALVTFVDFNGGIVRSRNHSEEPLDAMHRMVSLIEKQFNIPEYFRLILTEEPGISQQMNQMARLICDAKSESYESFSDYQTLTRLLTRANAYQSVLTTDRKHTVRSVLERLGLSRIDEILGNNSNFNVSAKEEIVTRQLVTSEVPPIVFLFDVDTESLAQSIWRSRGNSADPASRFVDSILWGSREDNSVVGTALRTTRIPSIAEQNLPFGGGFAQSIELLQSYLKYLPQSPINLDLPAISYDTNYKTGDIVETCRSRIEQSRAIPVPAFRTIVKPDQSAVRAPETQFDLGVPTLLKANDGKIIVLYKAATAPSGQTSHHPSNTYAARYDPMTNNVEFFDHERTSSTASGIKPLLKSALPEKYSKDGLHDPRATYIPALGKWLILACAFNKDEEQRTMKEAGGDTSKPIQGAYTELFVTDDPANPHSYTPLGQFGPDFHFKNMVFMEELRTINGEDCLLLMTRKMPSIQIVPIPVQALDSAYWSKHRDTFWKVALDKRALAKSTVLEPLLPHEGFGNPFGPYNHADRTNKGVSEGQVSPGMAPLKVEISCGNGVRKPAWLLIYNSVPDFADDTRRSACGRVICGALLDYEDPRKLLARSPVPLITPRRTADYERVERVKARHPDVVFTGGGCIDDHGGLVVAYTGNDTTVEIARWSSVSEVAEFISQFDANGNTRIVDLQSSRMPAAADHVGNG